MNDTLEYIDKDPVHRRYDHWHLTFSLIYAFTENFILPFSHDEVVHGKGSMFEKIPGDDWQRAATLRTLYGFMYAHPGKKLMFMGARVRARGASGTTTHSLDWHLLEFPMHAGIQRFVKDLNRTYAAEPALHEVDFDYTGFQWIDCNDSENSVISFIRRARDSQRPGRRAAELHARAARRLPHRRAGGRRLHGAAQQRCGDLRRQQPGQRRPDLHRADRVTRPSAVAASEPAAAGFLLLEAGEMKASS